MEDILASIRRILNEDEPGPSAPPASRAPSAPPRPQPAPDVFALDASMMVPDPAPTPPGRKEPPPVATRIEPKDPEPGPPPLSREVADIPVVEVVDHGEGEMPPLPLVLPASPSAAPSLVPAPAPASSSTTEPAAAPPSWPASLVAPEAAAAAALSVGSLRRTLEAGRASLAVRGGGPTLDDMVREELRPVLKAWLDANLAPMVERLVRAEIERVVGRTDL